MNCADLDEDLYTFKNYGKTMKNTASWTPRSRSDIIPWCSSLFQQELQDKFVVDSTRNDLSRRSVLQIIHNNLDSFCQVGTVRPILDLDFLFIPKILKLFAITRQIIALTRLRLWQITSPSQKITAASQTMQNIGLLYYFQLLNRINNLVLIFKRSFRDCALVTVPLTV